MDAGPLVVSACGWTGNDGTGTTGSMIFSPTPPFFGPDTPPLLLTSRGGTLSGGSEPSMGDNAGGGLTIGGALAEGSDGLASVCCGATAGGASGSSGLGTSLGPLASGPLMLGPVVLGVAGLGPIMLGTVVLGTVALGVAALGPAGLAASPTCCLFSSLGNPGNCNGGNGDVGFTTLPSFLVEGAVRSGFTISFA